MNNGVFYSLLTISMLSLLLVYNQSYIGAVQSQGEQASLRFRGAELYNFVDGINDDFPRILDISARRALISAVSDVVSSGVALTNSEDGIKELMVNGSLRGTAVVLMDTSNFNYWMSTIENMGSRRGFNASLALTSLEVKQLDAFHLFVNASLEANASDYFGTMNFSKTYYATDIVDLANFEDPLFPINTRGLTKKPVVPAPHDFNGVQEVEAAITNNYYMPSPEGPSFLDRLEGKIRVSTSHASNQSTTIGLESVVFLPGLQAQGLDVKQNQTTADYLYFNSTDIHGYQVLNSSYLWLKFDQDSATRYNVSINMSS